MVKCMMRPLNRQVLSFRASRQFTPAPAGTMDALPQEDSTPSQAGLIGMFGCGAGDSKLQDLVESQPHLLQQLATVAAQMLLPTVVTEPEMTSLPVPSSRPPVPSHWMWRRKKRKLPTDQMHISEVVLRSESSSDQAHVVPRVAQTKDTRALPFSPCWLRSSGTFISIDILFGTLPGSSTCTFPCSVVGVSQPSEKDAQDPGICRTSSCQLGH